MKTKVLILSLIAAQFLFSCSEKADPIPPPPVQVELEIQSTVAEKWGAITLRHIFVQPAKTPTYVSRSLAYIGLI